MYIYIIKKRGTALTIVVYNMVGLPAVILMLTNSKWLIKCEKIVETVIFEIYNGIYVLLNLESFD